MKKIPMTMAISPDDVEQFSTILEMSDEGSFMKSFSERFLKCAKGSCAEIRRSADHADSFNPYCMEKISTK